MEMCISLYNTTGKGSMSFEVPFIPRSKFPKHEFILYETGSDTLIAAVAHACSWKPFTDLAWWKKRQEKLQTCGFFEYFEKVQHQTSGTMLGLYVLIGVEKNIILKVTPYARYILCNDRPGSDRNANKAQQIVVIENLTYHRKKNVCFFTLVEVKS